MTSKIAGDVQRNLSVRGNSLSIFNILVAFLFAFTTITMFGALFVDIFADQIKTADTVANLWHLCFNGFWTTLGLLAGKSFTPR
jgi:hypothetical protein